jgi:peptidoglycan/xylan/chitin deacetylase (PgdA/CDA1 family)
MLRQLAQWAFHHAGGLALVRRQHQHKARILMYHRFAPSHPTVRTWIEEHCQHLRRHYHVMPLGEMTARLAEGAPLPHNSLAITVDDGHRDFYTHAFPLFQKYNLPATLYLTTGYLDRQGWLWFDLVDYLFSQTRQRRLELNIGALQRTWQWNEGGEAAVAEPVKLGGVDLSNQDRLRLMRELPERLGVPVPEHPPEAWAALRWDEVREMARHGIEFGAHTVTHPILAKVESPEEQRWEIEESKRRVEAELQMPVKHFCYPNGQPDDISPAIVEIVRQAGFQNAVTAQQGLSHAQTPLFLLKRIPVGNDYGPDLMARTVAGWRLA